MIQPEHDAGTPSDDINQRRATSGDPSLYTRGFRCVDTSAEEADREPEAIDLSRGLLKNAGMVAQARGDSGRWSAGKVISSCFE